MIRLARIADADRVVELMDAAHPHSAIAAYAPYDANMARVDFIRHCRSADSLCLVLEVSGLVQGIFVAVAHDHPRVPVRIAVEVVSWIMPSYRGMAWFKIKRSYESWAKEKRCKAVFLSSKKDKRFQDMIERDGYAPVEEHFGKVL